MTTNPSVALIIAASAERIRHARGPAERGAVQHEHIDSVSRAMAEMIFAAAGATPGLSDEDVMEAVNNTQLIVVNVAKQMLKQHGLGEPEMTHVECASVAEHAFKARFAELARAASVGGIA